MTTLDTDRVDLAHPVAETAWCLCRWRQKCSVGSMPLTPGLQPGCSRPRSKWVLSLYLVAALTLVPAGLVQLLPRSGSAAVPAGRPADSRPA
jgi:hypothetical protein